MNVFVISLRSVWLNAVVAAALLWSLNYIYVNIGVVLVV